MAVYPRWRGEHRDTSSRACVVCGLSPLARGTHIAARRTLDQRRFIPAGAGNTAGATQDQMLMAVYPRWRGEHNCERFFTAQRAGLSPLARGTH